MTTEKKTRTPRSADAITAGALSLPLQERVDMISALQTSVDKEVADLQAQAATAAKIASVLAPAATR